jgi:hypothetical protein
MKFSLHFNAITLSIPDFSSVHFWKNVCHSFAEDMVLLWHHTSASFVKKHHGLFGTSVCGWTYLLHVYFCWPKKTLWLIELEACRNKLMLPILQCKNVLLKNTLIKKYKKHAHTHTHTHTRNAVFCHWFCLVFNNPFQELEKYNTIHFYWIIFNLMTLYVSLVCYNFMPSTYFLLTEMILFTGLQRKYFFLALVGIKFQSVVKFI